MNRLTAAVVLVGALALAGCSTGATSVSTPSPVTSATQAPVKASSAEQAATKPSRIQYLGIGANSTLEPVGLNPDKTIAVPPVTQPGQAAWFDKSPVPGNVGPSIILGHINGGGQPGVFARLADSKAGDQIEVLRNDGSTVIFTVDRVKRVAKADFPTAEVYSDTPNAQLRLISCGGALDRTEHSYVDNVIVFASMTGLRPA